MLNEILIAIRKCVFERCRWRIAERALAPGRALKNGTRVLHDQLIEARQPPAPPPTPT